MGFMDELKLFVIVSMLLPIAFCTPIEQEQTNGMVDEPEPLSRRGAENMTPLEQYARDKYEEYVSESGKFRYGVDEPTNVWFLPDKDVAQGYFRAKPQRTADCATYTQYVFQWSSVASENTPLNIRSGSLRAYIQPISRHIKNDETVNVALTIKMVPRDRNDITNHDGWSNSILAGQQVISVYHDSEGWAELNVAKGVIEIWPLRKNYAEVQVIIIAEVDCIEQKIVPFKFINPAEIPLDTPLRREHYLPFQPFLVINADNEMTKKLLQYSEMPIRSKRQSTPDICSRSDYTVNLYEIVASNIILPERDNIFKCSGTCDYPAILNTNTTTHANAAAFAQVVGAQMDGACCVPITYNPIVVLIEFESEFFVETLNDLVVSECGCR